MNYLDKVISKYIYVTHLLGLFFLVTMSRQQVCLFVVSEAIIEKKTIENSSSKSGFRLNWIYSLGKGS